MGASGNQLSYYFCQEMDMSLLEQYAASAQVLLYKKGQVIIPADTPVDHLYYLAQGSAVRKLHGPSGKEKIIKVLSEKSLFGEILFFKGGEGATDAEIIATSDCRVYRFERLFVNEVLLQKDPDFTPLLIRWLCNRLVNLNNQVRDDLVKDPHYHIGKFLYDYVQTFGEQNPDGTMVYYGKLSHYDIAKYLGINRVTVTTVLNHLQNEGLLHKTTTLLILLDPDYFAQF